MAGVKHRSDAGTRVDEYIASLPEWSRLICSKLRAVIMNASPGIIEDWKWGPNYFCEGMVCGFGAFKSHVTLTFFQGAVLSDTSKVLLQNPGNLHNRHIKFGDVQQVKVKLITSYIKEAISNNRSGIKTLQPGKKEVVVHPDLAMALRKAKLLSKFESFTYYKRKELSEWVNAAKRDETRKRRIADAVEQVREGKSINDHYRKKHS